VVSGSGGFTVHPPRTIPQTPLTQGEFTLVGPPILEFGYMTLTVDMSIQPQTLTIRFRAPANPAVDDHVIVDLTTSKIIPG